MVSGVAPFCPLCAVVHAINLIMLFPLKRLAGRPWGQVVRTWGRGARYLVGGKPSDPAAARWKLVGFFTAGLVSVVVYQWVYVEVALRSATGEVPFDPVEMIVQFESGVRQEIPVSAADASLGPADAPVRMVVFSDFQCPGCTKLARTVPSLARRFGGRLQIVFKHFPLDSSCNPLIKNNVHPKACAGGRAVEAAGDQGKFWAFHDEIFMPRSEGKRTLKAMVERLDMDFDRFEAHRNGQAGLAKIKADIDLGISLGLKGTPTVFLDGRRVRDTRPEALRALIDHQLEHVSGTASHD